MNFFLLFFIFLSTGSQAVCLPDSKGFQGTNLVFDMNGAERTIESFYETLKDDLPEGNELVINLDALNPRVNADINKVENSVVIQVMGGMVQHPKMNSEVLQLLLCHEIGHFLGGSPTKSRNGWSSTEGQSDYYSALKCARALGYNEVNFIDAALRLTSIYAEVTREPAPKLDQCDERIVTRTNYGYPSAQCRLDTLMAGWVGSERPKCWFSE